VQLADESPAGVAADHSMEVNAMTERETQSERARDAFKFGTMTAEIIELKEQLYALRTGAAAGARVSGLSKQQIDERLRSGLCLRCGIAGHYKNDCPRAQ